MKPIDSNTKNAFDTPRSHRTKMTLLSLSLLVFIDAVSFGLVIPLFIPLFIDPQHSILPAATSISMRHILYAVSFCIPMITILIGSPLLGSLSDKWGRKKVLLLGLSGVMGSFILSMIAIIFKNVWLFLLSRAITGFMDGTQSIAQAAATDVSQTAHKAKNLSIVTLSGNIGFAAGPLLGGLFSSPKMTVWFGYATPFIVANLAILLNIILLAASFKETFFPKEQAAFSVLQGFRDLGFAFVDQRILKLSVCYIMMQTAWAGFFQSVSVILVQFHHYTSIQLGWYFSFLSLIFSFNLICIVNKMILRKVNSSVAARYGLLVISISLVVTALAWQTLMGMYLCTVLITLGVAMSANTFLAMFSDAVSEQEQGRTMGISVALAAVAWATGSGSIGFINGVHSIIAIYLCLAIIPFAAFIILRNKVTAS